MARFMSIDEVQKANEKAGGHFFDRATMRGFDSRVCADVFVGPRGAFFVTSERFHGSQGSGRRLYTVRRLDVKTGDVSTAPGRTFQEFKSRTGALAAAKRDSMDVLESEWRAWLADELVAETARRVEDDRRQLRWLEHIVKVRRAQNVMSAIEQAETHLRMFREDHPNLEG